MNLKRSYKIALVTLLVAKSFLAGAQTNSTVPPAAIVPPAAQTNSAAAPVDYSSFSKFITERNIFNPNRVAHVLYVPGSYVPPLRTPDSFTLVGTLSYEKGDFAFFDGTSSQYRKAVRLNETIAGFKVTNIEPNSVTLLLDTNTTVLKIGEQMRDDGEGHWLSANQLAARSGNGSTRNSGRNNNNNRYSFRRNRGNTGNFNGGRGGYAARSSADSSSTSDNSQTEDSNMAVPDGVIVLDNMGTPDDATAPVDATAPDNTPAPETPVPTNGEPTTGSNN